MDRADWSTGAGEEEEEAWSDQVTRRLSAEDTEEERRGRLKAKETEKEVVG